MRGNPVAEPTPLEQIDAHIANLQTLDDSQLLDLLKALAPLVDESDALWHDPRYWSDCAYFYVALRVTIVRRWCASLSCRTPLLGPETLAGRDGWVISCASDGCPHGSRSGSRCPVYDHAGQQ